MQTSPSYAIYPIATVLAQIVHDDADPWVAIGNFLHDWWCYAKTYRHELIVGPPLLADIHMQPQWAAFCAATVEEVCRRTPFPRPAWVDDPIFVLAEPWRLPSAPSEDDDDVDAGLPAFRHRNILVGSNVLDNKYALQERYPQVTHRYLSWTDQEIQHLVQNGDKTQETVF